MAMSQLPTFMAAIRRLESGSYAGVYNAVGPTTRTGDYAVGTYQIMKSNWDWWTEKWGIAGADWRDSAAQDFIAERQFKEYYNKYQDWGLVAIAWFGGPGAADTARDKGIGAVGNRTDMLGTSISKYADLIDKYMANAPSIYRNDGIGSMLPEDDRQAALAGGRFVDQGRTANPLDAALSDPNAQMQAWLSQQWGEQAGDPPAIRPVLTSMLSALSNSIAGGEREPIDRSAVGELDADPLERRSGNLLRFFQRSRGDVSTQKATP